MKIAGVQMDVQLGKIDSNVEKMITLLKETTAAGAQLTIFPECAATGYCFESLEEAREYAQSIPGPVTEQMSRACADLNCFAVFGMLEANGSGIFNAAVLTGPDGVI
ncbi:MAG: carbon-nitrogen hydrolase family protein, partial [Planctomycetes bacterium]|nr:carbon-nitrogen hydrolase family protein [Planctomycetota bacterium]